MFTNNELFLNNQQFVVHNVNNNNIDTVNTTLSLKKYADQSAFLLVKNLKFNLMDLTMTDCLDFALRFTLVHNVYNLHSKSRLFFEKNLRLMETAMSASHTFISASCAEREVYDMFGTFFIGHEDLRRLLTDYSFVGYPLRKDFPLTGFLELSYSVIDKTIVSKPVKFTQELRQMEYTQSWNIQQTQALKL